MEANRQDPEIFIEGIDKIIRRDRDKHKELLARTHTELEAFETARKHESAKKRHYYRQIGKGKYNDDALRRSCDEIRVNIQHFTDRIKQAKEKIKHHQLIVSTLTQQLKDYDEAYGNRYKSKQQADPDN